MKLEITGKKENKALERQEAEFVVKEAKTTPSRKEIKPKIAAMLNANEELTVITGIEHAFGKTEAIVKANVYSSKTAMNNNEQKHLIQRDKGKKDEKAPAAKAEAEGKKEEQPAEKKDGKKKESEKKPAEEKKEGEQ